MCRGVGPLQGARVSPGPQRDHLDPNGVKPGLSLLAVFHQEKNKEKMTWIIFPLERKKKRKHDALSHQEQTQNQKVLIVDVVPPLATRLQL